MQDNFIQNKWEYTIPVAFSLSLIFACIITSGKSYLWSDELLSLYFVNDPSFTHMITALSDTINSSPPLYFVLGWIWSKIFTASELSLRLFSCISICFAQTIVWLTLRRTYSFWAASWGTLIGLASNQIIFQNSQSRFYGLFIAICALVFMKFDSLCRQRYKYSNSEFSNSGLLVNIFIHIAIIYTHFYGFLYSGATLFALIISDKYFKIFRPKIYASFILAWLAFIPWIPAFIRQSQLGTWMEKPALKDLVYSFNDWSPRFFLPILLIVLCLILVIKPKGIYNFNHTKKKDIEISLLILASSWVSISILTWLVSISLQPVFLQRYLIPAQISWSILLSYLFSYLVYPTFKLERKLLTVNIRLLCLVIITVFLVLKPLYTPNKEILYRKPGAQDYKYGYNNLPIVTEICNNFMERFYHYGNNQNNPYVFVLNRETALDQKNSALVSYQDKLMDALARNYRSIFDKNILNSQDFLNSHPRFLVLHSHSCLGTDLRCRRIWFHRRIENNPKYRISQLGVVDDNNRTMLLVETK